MIERKLNFSAGPACLPEIVVKESMEALWSLGDSGIGICEHSHRGPEFSAVLSDATETIRSLASVSNDYDILYLQGGASTQFFMIPMNFLGEDQHADYIHTGTWSKKAIAEAKRFGGVRIASSSEEKSFSEIPDEYETSEKSRYLHFTSNNTIVGTQFQKRPTPASGAQLICDASSDIFSRPLDTSKYDLIYAGAQKNLGPSGLTLVIIKKSLVESGPTSLPTMLQYRTHADKGSMFNTPPTFGIYVLSRVLRWIVDFGGLEAIGEYNREKAGLLYRFLDDSQMFEAAAAQGSRSQMNVTFRTQSADVDAQFIRDASAAGFSGLKGHRSVGGMRASIYNAFPRDGVLALVDFMKKFESRHG